MKAPFPADEAERIKELQEYRILDTESEVEYDDLVLLASNICNTPIALMSLVDTQCQYFKSRIGLDATETPRDISFCAHLSDLPSNSDRCSDASTGTRFTSWKLFLWARIVQVNGHPTASSVSHPWKRNQG